MALIAATVALISIVVDDYGAMMLNLILAQLFIIQSKL